jgi:hypothetical protein
MVFSFYKRNLSKASWARLTKYTSEQYDEIISQSHEMYLFVASNYPNLTECCSNFKFEMCQGIMQYLMDVLKKTR